MTLWTVQFAWHNVSVYLYEAVDTMLPFTCMKHWTKCSVYLYDALDTMLPFTCMMHWTQCFRLPVWCTGHNASVYLCEAMDTIPEEGCSHDGTKSGEQLNGEKFIPLTTKKYQAMASVYFWHQLLLNHTVVTDFLADIADVTIYFNYALNTRVPYVA